VSYRCSTIRFAISVMPELLTLHCVNMVLELE